MAGALVFPMWSSRDCDGAKPPLGYVGEAATGQNGREDTIVSLAAWGAGKISAIASAEDGGKWYNYAAEGDW